MHRGDFVHLTSIRVLKANTAFSDDQGLFLIENTNKNVKVTSSNGRVTGIHRTEENTSGTIRFNLHHLSSEEGIEFLSEGALKELDMFTMLNRSILSDEISEYLKTFEFSFSDHLTNPRTGTLCILVQVLTFRIIEYAKDEEYLSCEDFMCLKAELVERARLDEPWVNFSEEIGTVFEVRVMDRDDDEEKCAICLENLVMGIEVVFTTNCMHLFHRDCLIEWLSKSNSCPMCRGNCTVNL